MIVSSEDTDAEDLQQLTFEMINSLNSETDVNASLPEEEGGVGDRGDVVTIGQILLAAVGGGGSVVALFEVIKAYFERKPSMQIEFKCADGKQMRIKAEQVSQDQIDQTIALGKSFLGQCDD
jgi:hypothetical protein